MSCASGSTWTPATSAGCCARWRSAGWSTSGPIPADGRRRRVTLTRRGRRTLARLEDRSDALAQDLLDPLTARQRARLVEALATADLLVRAATVHLREVDPRSPAAVAAVDQYFAELDRRFPDGFDAASARAADAAAMAPGVGTFVVATSDGRPVACGGVQTIAPGVAEIKRMWVTTTWRGAGLGSRLLRHLEALARCAATTSSGWTPTARWRRRSRCTSARATGHRALQRQPVRRGVVREGPRRVLRRWAREDAPVPRTGRPPPLLV